MSLDEMIAVMQHYRDGGEVEYRSYSYPEWKDAVTPIWNFNKYDYRIKEKTKTVYEWMFKDNLGNWFVSDSLFTEEEAKKYISFPAQKTGRQWEVSND